MSDSFEDFICKYVRGQIGLFKRYLLAALNSQERYLCYMGVSLGTPLPSQDIRNCELLVDAGLFREELRLTRDGRNTYKLFYLTEMGKDMAEKIREENVTDELPETPQFAETGQATKTAP